MTTGQTTDPLIGRLVDGRYRVRARIARGGMATVYVATDLRLERRIALKVMHAHLTDDSLFESRFIQEARQAARLADPHVVNVFDQGRDGDMAYLVMEYLPGITLRDLLREQRRLSVPQTITIMDAVVSGLAAAHAAGIVHRDVKPENVLLAEDGRIKIGDFGLARATTANTASGALLMGTIAYLAPELVTRGTADARSDIYSLGIMLYEMLVGEQPYKGEQPMQIAFQHATDSVPRPSVRNPGVPEQLDELVLWATERETADRPEDAGELLARLREVEEQLGVRPRVTRPTSTRIAPLGADDAGDSGALTKVLPGAFTAPTVTHDVDSATRLRRRMKRDASKGAWLLALVVLLAVLAAGAGWWFGSGPGSLVEVSDVAGAAGYDEAAAVLAGQGFAPTAGATYSIDVPTGTVVGTDPPAGSRLDKGSAVTVLVSQGPAPHDVPALTGISASDARRALADDAKLDVGDDDRVYSDAPADTVVGAVVTPRDGSGAIDCGSGCSVHEGDGAVLQVSAGPIPDVSGASIASATEQLQGVGLVVAGANTEEYSDTLAAGLVIGLVPAENGAPRHPNDTVTLVVSQGPQLFPVPDVSGKTLAQAKQAIADAGFRISYDTRWDSFPDAYTVVESQSPGSTQQEPAGTTISVVVRASL